MLGVLLVGRLTATPTTDAPPPGRASTTAAERADFEDALGGGGAAGIAAYLVTHPSPRGLRGATRFTTIERHGSGPATIRLGAVPPGPGRATVLVVLRSSASVRTALTGEGRVLDARQGRQEAGELATATVRFAAGAPPAALRVDLPTGVRWGAAVVLSD